MPTPFALPLLRFVSMIGNPGDCRFVARLLRASQPRLRGVTGSALTPELADLAGNQIVSLPPCVMVGMPPTRFFFFFFF